MANLLITAVRPSIGPIVLNCTMRERHGGAFAISDAPIEDGSFITDHAIELPRILDIDAVISPFPDNPVDELRSAYSFIRDSIQTQSFRSPLDYAADVWARIRALASSMEPFEVTTDREHYKQMIFESYECIDANNPGSTFLTATLRQVQFAKTRTDTFSAADQANELDATDDVGVQSTEVLQ